MNAIEYKRTWENGQKNFAKMEHSKAICKLMDIELNDIIDFPNQPYEKIREYQLKKNNQTCRLRLQKYTTL